MLVDLPGALPGRHSAADKGFTPARKPSLSLQEVCGLSLALVLEGH